MVVGLKKVLLCGMDFGSTTSSFLLAEARIGQNFATGERVFDETAILHRAEPVFTPFRDGRIDEPKIAARIDDWIDESGLTPADIFAGGAIVTGLAARRDNAAALVKIVRLRIGRAMMATADDPTLESWLAFMGAAARLSRFHAGRPFVNLDIGGGTTNPAFGIGGVVRAAGCYFIGARHFQFAPGTYRLTAVSEFGRMLTDELGVAADVGDELGEPARGRILDRYTAGLEAMVRGERGFFATPAGRTIEQAAFVPPPSATPEITYTGGVGELIYRLAAGEPVPETTAYGDLGIDLARKIFASKFLSRSLKFFVPETKGRATVYGVTLHATEVSGASIYLPRVDLLPLSDLPIVARISADAAPAAYVAALKLAAMSVRGAGLQIAGKTGWSAAYVRALGEKIAAALDAADVPTDRPLVVLVEKNLGKALGNYATGWGKTGRTLIVIDEVSVREAAFVNIGAVQGAMVPIAYFGMR
jgi:ethanolamine utilization protein EutA